MARQVNGNIKSNNIVGMFLSIYRLKYFVSIGIVITLLIGVALLYVLVYSFIISSITAQVQPNFRTLLMTVFLSTSLLMILSSLSGIYGLIRRKNKFVVVYAGTMIFYMVSFLLLAIFTLSSPEYINSQCQSSEGNEYESTVSEAKSLLCKNNCECYFTNGGAYTDQELNEMDFTNNSSSIQTLPINSQNCPTWNNDTYHLTVQLAILESFFNCSGWCQSQPNLYYLFTNVNNGRPSTTCVVALSNFLDNFGHIIQISSFTVSSFLFIVLIVICGLWLHPDRGLKYDSLQIFKETLMFVDEEKKDKEEDEKV